MLFYLIVRTTGATRPITAHRESGRTLIAASVGSVAESLSEVDQTQLICKDSIAKLTGWHKKSNTNWNRETVIRGFLEYKREFKINYQFQPVPGQLGNIYVRGVGRYSDEEAKSTLNILTIFNRLTEEDPDKEKLLASVLLRYKRGDGSALNESNLRELGLILPATSAKRKTLLQQFNRAAFLICFQEVSRRKHQGYRVVKKDRLQMVPELPFGIAVACLLKLLSDGHLRMADVFNEDALYGVFTGTGVMSDNLLKTIQKFNDLFVFFVDKYAPQLYELFEYGEAAEELNVVFTPEYFHKILRASDAGEEDSDNEEYDLPEGDDENTSLLEEQIAELKFTPFKLTL